MAQRFPYRDPFFVGARELIWLFAATCIPMTLMLGWAIATSLPPEPMPAPSPAADCTVWPVVPHTPAVPVMAVELDLNADEPMALPSGKGVGLFHGGGTLTETGLYYEDVTVGAGVLPGAGTKVSVHYEMTLLDGSTVDSSRERDRAFVFPLSDGRVIAGFDEAIASMRVGGRRLVVIPARLAYGEREVGVLVKGPPKIPAGSALVADIELLEVLPPR